MPRRGWAAGREACCPAAALDVCAFTYGVGVGVGLQTPTHVRYVATQAVTAVACVVRHGWTHVIKVLISARQACEARLAAQSVRAL